MSHAVLMWIIMSAVFLVAAVLIFFLGDIRYCYYDEPIGYLFLACLLLFLISSFMALTTHSKEEDIKSREEGIERAIECDEAGWTFYLEGHEIDIENVYLEDYEFIFKEENQKVILRKK